jgi:phosphoribosylamine-glycine ligase
VVIASPEYPNGSAPRRTLILPEKWNGDCTWIPSGVDAENSTSAGRIGGVLCSAAQAEQAVSGCYAQVSGIRFGTPVPAVPHFRTDISFPNIGGDESQK